MQNIEDCCVVYNQSIGKGVLIAFIKNKISSISYTKEEYRKQLAFFLPPAMIPSEFVNVERFPLSTNGKIDRKGLAESIQKKYMLNIDSYTAAPVSLFSIVNKAHCQKKDLVNALMGQKNSNQKAFIWVRQNKGNDSRCIYFEGKNPSVLTGEILAITANAIFEMPRKDGIYTMASYLEKYQVLDELKKIDKFKSEGKI